jgi:hypothetical protein
MQYCPALQLRPLLSSLKSISPAPAEITLPINATIAMTSRRVILLPPPATSRQNNCRLSHRFEKLPSTCEISQNTGSPRPAFARRCFFSPSLTTTRSHRLIHLRRSGSISRHTRGQVRLAWSRHRGSNKSYWRTRWAGSCWKLTQGRSKAAEMQNSGRRPIQMKTRHLGLCELPSGTWETCGASKGMPAIGGRPGKGCDASSVGRIPTGNRTIGNRSSAHAKCRLLHVGHPRVLHSGSPSAPVHVPFQNTHRVRSSLSGLSPCGSGLETAHLAKCMNLSLVFRA